MSGAEVFGVIGIVSSILQIIDFSAKVSVHVRDVIIGGKDDNEINSRSESLIKQYDTLCRNLAASASSTDEMFGVDLTLEEHAVTNIREKCQLEAHDLLNRLEKLRISSEKTGLKKLVQGTAQAMKATTQRHELEQRRQRLQELNGQLANALMQCLLAGQQRQSDVLAEIVRKVDESTEDTVTKVLSLQRVQATTETILKDLHYPELGRREDLTELAYAETCQWSLKNATLGLRYWLQYQNSTIYWINGKAGSGKSTLMKYLSRSEEVRSLLSKWAGSKRLIIAAHYFWFSGTPMQKSIEGLFRGLLHQFLTHEPALAQLAFPGRFGGAIPKDGASGTREARFTFTELDHALRTLGEHGSTGGKTRFCAFIDGLDEYHGNHGELVSLIRDLSRNMDLKLCVSSRPWNPFRNAFEGKVQSLKVDLLSRADMLRYVRGKILEANASYGIDSIDLMGDLDELVTIIVERSQGVFLWVFLVVRSILSGISEGDDVAFLMTRVQSFPADLEKYFQGILDRVDPEYMMQTHQILKLAWLCIRDGHELSLIDFWLVRRNKQGLESPRFALDLPMQYTSQALQHAGSLYDRQAIVDQTRTFLSARCKDLFYVPESRARLRAPADLFPQPELLHRSVYDFLDSQELQERLDMHVPAYFHTPDVFVLLQLARLKFINSFRCLCLYTREEFRMARKALEGPTTLARSKHVSVSDIAIALKDILGVYASYYCYTNGEFPRTLGDARHAVCWKWKDYLQSAYPQTRHGMW